MNITNNDTDSDTDSDTESDSSVNSEYSDITLIAPKTPKKSNPIIISNSSSKKLCCDICGKLIAGSNHNLRNICKI